MLTACSAIILPGLAWSVLPLDWELPLYGGKLAFKSWRLFILFLLAVGRREEALAVLARVHAFNTGEKDFPVRQLTEDTSSIMANTTDRSFLTLMKIVVAQTVPLFSRPFLLHTFLVCFIQFGNIASASGLLMWLPELFNYQARYGEMHEGAATICEAVAGVIAADRNSTAAAPGAAARAVLSTVAPDAATACGAGTILTQVYINALIIGVADAIAPIFGSLVVN
ncbi:Synaptic vesicle glycoprotein 2B, partial [Frankliniella fusca]